MLRGRRRGTTDARAARIGRVATAVAIAMMFMVTIVIVILAIAIMVVAVVMMPPHLGLLIISWKNGAAASRRASFRDSR